MGKAAVAETVAAESTLAQAKATAEVKKSEAANEQAAAEKETTDLKEQQSKAEELGKKKVEDAKAAAKAKTQAVKAAGEVDSLVKSVQDVAAKQVADKTAEGTSALSTAQESTRTVKSMAEDLSKKLALNIENFDVAISDLKSVAPTH